MPFITLPNTDWCLTPLQCLLLLAVSRNQRDFSITKTTNMNWRDQLSWSVMHRGLQGENFKGREGTSCERPVPLSNRPTWNVFF